MDEQLAHFEKRFDFNDFYVILRTYSITFGRKNDLINIEMFFSSFQNKIEPEEDGGRMEIKWRNNWGCEMVFVHYAPGDLEGMFRFIGNGYRVFVDFDKAELEKKLTDHE